MSTVPRKTRRVMACLAAVAVVTSSLFAADTASAEDSVPVPAADILEVDFATGGAVDTSAAERPTITQGAPAFAEDTQLGKTVATFNRLQFGGANGDWKLPSTWTADGFTYDVQDIWTGSNGTLASGAITVECQFRLNEDMPLTKEQDVCGNKNGGGIGFYINSTNLYAQFQDSTSTYRTIATSEVVGGKWYDAVASYDASTGTASFYLDGEKIGDYALGAIRGPATANQYFAAGGSPAAGGGINYRGDVSMAAARVWSTALTEAEIQQLATDSGIDKDAPAVTPATLVLPKSTGADLPTGVTWPTAVPRPDLLDVSFVKGNLADAVTNGAPSNAYSALNASGAPTPALPSVNTPPVIETDATLGRQVAVFDGSKALAYPTTTTWQSDSPVRANQTITYECVFIITGTASHEQDPCGSKYSGGIGFYTSAAGTTLNGIIGTPSYVSAASPIQLNTWYHAVLTYDGNTVTLYLNGKPTSMATVSAKIAPPTHRFFGVGGTISNAGGTTVNNNPYTGIVGKVAANRSWSSVLTEDQIADLAAISGVPGAGDETGPGATVTVPEANILDVTFEHGSPRDQVSGDQPIVKGSPQVSFDADLGSSVATFNAAANGTAGGAATDGYVYDLSDEWSVGSSPNITRSVTMECYFKYNGTLPVTTENDVCSGKQTGGYAIYITGSSVGAMFYIGGAYASVTAPLTAGIWTHVVATYDGSSIRLYVNGQVKALRPVSGRAGAPGATAFVLGADTAGTIGNIETGAPATISVSRIWSQGLSAAQVAKLYQQDTTAVVAPEADILDVDFSGSSYADGAAGRIGTQFGAPVISEDPTLRRPVASFDGNRDAVIYPISDAWNSNNTPNLANAVTLQCDFRYDGTLPTNSERDVCAGKETGGYAAYVNGSQAGVMLYINGSYRNVRAPIQAGQWYSMVATYDRATGLLQLYLNGKLRTVSQITGDYAGSPPNSAPANWAWSLGSDIDGSANPQTPAPVTISEARLFGRALTDAEVRALYIEAFGAGQTEISLTSSVPAAGDQLTAPVELSATIANRVQATGWTYTLDGTKVQPGSMIGAGLTAGNHTLEITATDVFGVPVSFTVGFTSVDIPGGTTGSGGGSTTSTTQNGGTVKLSAIASSSNGGDVTTTFHRAIASVAAGGTQGTVARQPQALDFASVSAEPLSGQQLAGDGATSASAEAHNLLPYQRFDVEIPDGNGSRLQWVGTIDPERAISLQVWDLTKSAWVEIASGRGNSSGDTTLVGAVPAGALDDGTVHVLAIASDPFADDLSSRDGAEAIADASHFEDPEDVDFSFVHWTDPQHIAVGAAAATEYNTGALQSDKAGYTGYWPMNPSWPSKTGVETGDEGAVWRAAYLSTTKWVNEQVAAGENADVKDISYVATTGDMIDNNIPTVGCDSVEGMCDEVAREFAATTDAIRELDGSGVPFHMIAGNHDNGSGQETGSGSVFSRTFTDQLIAQASSWENAEYHVMGEDVDGSGNPIAGTGDDAQNSYVLFSAGGLEFVAVGLSYGVTQDEADWASGVFRKYSDRNGILITHAYLGASGSPDGRGAAMNGDGSRLYNAVVSANPNVFLVLAGHVHGVGTNLTTTEGPQIQGKVVELLADYQEYQVRADKVFTAERCTDLGITCVTTADGIDVGGDGTVDYAANALLKFGSTFSRILQFNEAAGTMSVDSYSPFFDEFGTHTYDSTSPARYNGAEDNFTVPVNLTTRTTSFTTDGMVIMTPDVGEDSVIGTATAPSGWPATVTWSGLTQGQTYAWTATSKDANGQALGSVDQFGGIFVANAAGTDATAPVLQVPEQTTLTVGDAFDPLTGVSATDNVDGDLTSQVTVVGSVDTAEAGTYLLTYTVSDANGNTAQASHTVKVKAAVVVPKTSTKLSVSDVTIKKGGKLTLSATVSDAEATGEVQFIIGDEQVLCQPALRGGVASCEVESHHVPTVGSHVVVAYYFGDATHAESQKAFLVKVEATDGGTSQPKTFTTAPAPKISGKLVVGQTLTAAAGTWSPAPELIAYQWYRDGQAIRYATSAQYKLAGADAGRKITVRVTAARTGYASASKTSAATKAVAKGTLTAKAPTISGTAKVGATVRAKVSGWTSGTKFSYQWYAGGKAIKGATKATYKLKAAQAGKKVTVRVTGTQPGYNTVTKLSAATKAVAKGTLTAKAPTISGTAKVGATVRAKVSGWTSGTKFSYQWYAGGKAIKGATKATYKLKAAQAGKKVTVRVTGKQTGYNTVAKTSAAKSVSKKR